MAKVSKAEKQEAINQLQELLRPGDTIYTRLDHKSASGMMRHVTPLILRVDPSKLPADSLGVVNAGEDVVRRWYLGYLVSKACDYNIARDHSLKVSGCGFDSGFDIVYAIGATVFPGGFGCAGEGCPSNDHSNGDRDYTPHLVGGFAPHEPGYVAHWHRDGGYAFKHVWL